MTITVGACASESAHRQPAFALARGTIYSHTYALRTSLDDAVVRIRGEIQQSDPSATLSYTPELLMARFKLVDGSRLDMAGTPSGVRVKAFVVVAARAQTSRTMARAFAALRDMQQTAKHESDTNLPSGKEDTSTEE